MQHSIPTNEMTDIFFILLIMQVHLEPKTYGLFGSYFLKLFLRTIFENTKNIVLVFSKKMFLFSKINVICVFQNKKN